MRITLLLPLKITDRNKQAITPTPQEKTQMKILTLYKHKMGRGIQHRHRNQTSGAGEERGNEKHSSSKGMWV